MARLVRSALFVLNLLFSAWLLRNATGMLMGGSWVAGMTLLGLSLVLATAPLLRQAFPSQTGMLLYLLGAIGSIVELAWPSPEGGGGPLRCQLLVASVACLLLTTYMLMIAREKARSRAIDQLLGWFLETVDAGYIAATSKDADLASYKLYEVFDVGVTSFFHDEALTRLQKAGVLDVRVVDTARHVRAAWRDIQQQLDVHDPVVFRASEGWARIARRCEEMSELTSDIRR